ncbi:MAG: hypothetical protein B7Z33_03890 [Sphingomonadales bacterium 12-68-11]|nr:MAG: hypothetical protein B7Z33_03890 [Sphingomonadales bacterium 12-68-11]
MNRFGLGARAGEPLPAQPREWLLRQLSAFDPRPAALAGAASSREATGVLVGRLQQLRQGNARPERPGAPQAATGQPMSGRAMSEQAMDASGMDGMNAELAALPAPARNLLREGRERFIADVGRRGAVALTSPTPFAERLVHFWANHFTVSAAKPQAAAVIGPHEFDAIRPHMTGRFADLLKAAVLHPAMLVYLDQFQSIGPNSRASGLAAARERPRGLNENLAREILELHTLGVGGGYSQADVTEFAGALTGWTLTGLGRRAARDVGEHGASFVALAHEPGARQVLGRTYRQDGPAQALAVLDDLAAHPATARHVATKLARHFAGDTPPAPMVARLEAAFTESGGDLPTVYRALVDSPEAWAEQPVKFRQPWEWTLAALRATGIEQVPAQRFTGLLNQLGQGAWQAPSPAGYDDLAASWLGPDALVRRAEVAERLAALVPEDDARALGRQLFGGGLSEATASAIARAETPAQATALLLVAPEMLRR